MTQKGWLAKGTAVFDSTGTYRYSLTRQKTPTLEGVRFIDKRLTFILLNPSIATETIEDPTIRRCKGYADKWGYRHLQIVNLFALRSTDPKALYSHPNPVGPENDGYIEFACQTAHRIIAAWGVHGALHDRGRVVMRLLADKEVFCLGMTKDGHPGHPLYLKADAEPFPLPRKV